MKKKELRSSQVIALIDLLDVGQGKRPPMKAGSDSEDSEEERKKKMRQARSKFLE